MAVIISEKRALKKASFSASDPNSSSGSQTARRSLRPAPDVLSSNLAQGYGRS